MKHEQVSTAKPGLPFPPGVKLDGDGAQFSIFSRHATGVTLLLFERSEDDTAFMEYRLDPVLNRTGDMWHIWISGITGGELYGYRMEGPYEPVEGHRFNANKLVLDPYARAISGNHTWDFTNALGYDPRSDREDLSFSKIDNVQHSPKCIVTGSYTENDSKERPINTPMHETIIYEMHVKGFTANPNSGVSAPGTYTGLTQKIPHLKELGITAIELMPIQEFDEFENVNTNPLTGEKLKNFWGYSTISFFAPKAVYSHSGTMGEQVQEFKDMVKEFHASGIEVILDIVFNHTAEGDHLGPTINFRGIDNSVYYILKKDKRFYHNFSGCGNTLNCNHPLVRDYILDCLRYWVVEMHVDGFRFDLASILGRDQQGNILSNPPLLERISEDPILRNTKIIAEAWDAGGAYQVGAFPGRWAEWNGRYRDDVRRFWKGDKNMVKGFATRLTGSYDLYGKRNKNPLNSINFVTCHDGFTMNDLVSYNTKHNIANGEHNRDGENNNHSYNLGIEGNEATPLIHSLRNRQVKNFLTTLFMSQGVPMILAGDEFRRTQQGNNNAYCQDNEISWLNWELRHSHADIIRFLKMLIGFRQNHPVLRQERFCTGETISGYKNPDCQWHGTIPGKPDWNYHSHSIALQLNGKYAKISHSSIDRDIYMVFNASYYNLSFTLPQPFNGKRWLDIIDTSRESPYDISGEADAAAIESDRIPVKKLSSRVLVSVD